MHPRYITCSAKLKNQQATEGICTEQPKHHQFSNHNHPWNHPCKQKTPTWCCYESISRPAKSCNYWPQTTRSDQENLLISAWFYGKNWPYVVLPCVKQLSGLFLQTPIDPDHFSLDPKLVQMLNSFRQRAPSPYESD